MTLTNLVVSLLAAVSGQAQELPDTPPGPDLAELRQEVLAALTELHRARAEADAAAFFASFASDAIIFGTAPTERFGLEEYRAWAAPAFARGGRTSVQPVEQNIMVADQDDVAWFDERLVRPSLGELRASGVLRRSGGAWKIVHLNTAFVMPNEVVGEFLRLRSRVPGNGSFGPPLPAAAVHEDLELLLTTLQSWHPALYEYQTREELDQAFDQARTAIGDSMTALEFERLLAPLIARVRCVHTRILPTPELEDVRRRRGAYLPFDLRLIDDRLSVRRYYGKGPGPPHGAEILTINGQPANRIVATLLAAIPSDGRIMTHKVQVLNDSFARLYSTLIDNPARFSIQYLPRDGNQPAVSTVAPMSFVDLRWARMAQDPAVAAGEGATLAAEFLAEEDTAVLTVHSFWPAAPEDFPAFIDGFFARIKAERLSNLILDLRHNRGGDPQNGAHLFSYLATESFRYLKSTAPSRPLEPAAERFDGKLYVLIGGRCTSTTGHFCSLVKVHERGTFIGEECGSTYICNDDSRTLTLPGSRIRVRIARTTFAAAVEGLPRDRGIQPDHLVRPTLDDVLQGVDVEMEFARRLIRASRQR